MLAHQDHGDFGGQASDNLIGGVYEPPLLLDLARLRHVAFHRGTQENLFIPGGGVLANEKLTIYCL
jgi:hypothetical protein